MLTFAFAQIVWVVAFQWYSFTSGDNGILSVSPASQANNKQRFYYLTLILSTLSILFLRH